MTQIIIENKPYEVKDGQNLLQACLSLGLNLPYFCWHPALGSVGACRQCAVKEFKDDQDEHGKLVMACMEPIAQGRRISIDDQEAKEFRESVIEWMMLSHPHDCPVCDEGGECHLQDMTVMTGHTYRCFRGKKRTFHNQDLGPLINHEMNRCIQCYRCVRFYRDYAGGRDFDAFGLHDQVYFGRFEDGVLESEFSGNLVEVCPTGVFTDKTLKEHYTRKWDLQTAPSLCMHCSLGCNTIPGESYGQLRRIRNRYNGEVNGYFLCDRGRYGYEFVNSDRRILYPRMAHPVKTLENDGHSEAHSDSREEVLLSLKSILSGEPTIIGIGSPRASLESNFALRSLVGPENFYLGISDQDYQMQSAIIDIYRTGPAQIPSLHDVALADAVLVLGEDVTNTAPMLALALRQSVRQKSLQKAESLRIPAWNDAAIREAAQQQKSPLFMAAVANTQLDDVATLTWHATPNELARLGYAIALDLGANLPALDELPGDLAAIAKQIAQALRKAERPLVVAGTSLGSLAILQAAANVSLAICAGGRPALLSYVVPECNSLGLSLLGGRSLESAMTAVQEGKVDVVIVLENDLYRHADREILNSFFENIPHVIFLDYLENATTSKAEFVLPVSTYAESVGTLVNNEGRAQRYFQVMAPKGEVMDSWRWLQKIGLIIGCLQAEHWDNLDNISAALAQELPIFAPILHAAPAASFRMIGQKIPRQPTRYSGRTAMSAQINVNEPKPLDDPDSPFTFSMEGYQGQPPAALIPRYWAPGWNSVQALNKFQSEVGGPMSGGDPGVRLLEPQQARKAATFTIAQRAIEARDDELLIVPLYHIFGSGELSILSPAIASLAPQPYLGMNPEDAERLHVVEGQRIKLTVQDASCDIPMKLIPSIPKGVAGMPHGLPGLPWMPLPAKGKLSIPEAERMVE